MPMVGHKDRSDFVRQNDGTARDRKSSYMMREKMAMRKKRTRGGPSFLLPHGLLPLTVTMLLAVCRLVIQVAQSI
jgi:hypothetical protein